MNFKNISTSINNFIATVIIDRPNVLNALDIATLKELISAFKSFDNDNAVRVVVITGSGEKSFISGADIAAMLEMKKEDALLFAKAGHAFMASIENCRKPVVAVVNGFALGGGTETALACDIVIASDKARFGLPEVKLGIYPGFGGTQRLANLIGPARAKELIFTGKIIDAKEALELGLVNKVVEHSKLMEEAMNVARMVAANAPLAIAAAKRLINRSSGTDLKNGLEDEINNFAPLFETKDRTEGMKAFLEKRKAEFEGK